MNDLGTQLSYVYSRYNSISFSPSVFLSDLLLDIRKQSSVNSLKKVKSNNLYVTHSSDLTIN